MSRIKNPMDEKWLKEEYEESVMKLVMARLAEWEGKKLLEENEELSKDPFYQPSEKAQQKFKKRLNQHFALFYLKKAARIFPSDLKKVVASFLIVMLILLTTVWNVEAVRIKVLNLMIRVQEKYTEIRFGHSSHPQIEWHNAYVPTKVPVGYRIVQVKNLKTIKSIEYENENNGYILFQQTIESSSMNVDTENADEVIRMKIQGEDGLVVRKNDVMTIVWKKEDRLFLILGSSTGLTEKDLIEMAESVTLLK